MKKLEWIIFYKLWVIWHSKLRKLYNSNTPQYYMIHNRPWYHLCCNGDNGGYRTNFCEWLENHWRNEWYYKEGDVH